MNTHRGGSNVRIVATSHAVPPRVVTNDELAAWLDTSDEWITSRTGIKQRHISSGQNTAELALAASHDALAVAGWSATDLDLIIVATMTPDGYMPSVAAQVQGGLGASRATAFDLSAACAGFVSALSVAHDLLAAGSARRALVIGAETLSKLLDWQDRSTAVLFGDGAGAVLVEADAATRPWASQLATYGDQGAVLTAGQTTVSAGLPHPVTGLTPLKMAGREVYRFATHRVPEAILATVAAAGLTTDQVDHYLLHQANARIISQVAKRLGQPLNKFPQNIANYGNTAAASEPILLDELARAGKIRRGDRLVLAAFGGGLTTATIVTEY